MKKLRLAIKYIFTTILGFITIFKHSFKKRVTLEYPEIKPVLNNNFRGEHALDVDKCIICRMCQRVCPVGAITIEKKDDKLVEYNVDLNKCIFCGNCQFNCPKGAITLGKNYELATDKKSDLILNINKLKSNFENSIKSEVENERN